MKLLATLLASALVASCAPASISLGVSGRPPLGYYSYNSFGTGYGYGRWYPRYNRFIPYYEMQFAPGWRKPWYWRDY